MFIAEAAWANDLAVDTWALGSVLAALTFS
jgi:hypothetical protein